MRVIFFFRSTKKPSARRNDYCLFLIRLCDGGANGYVTVSTTVCFFSLHDNNRLRRRNVFYEQFVFLARRCVLGGPDVVVSTGTGDILTCF